MNGADNQSVQLVTWGEVERAAVVAALDLAARVVNEAVKRARSPAVAVCDARRVAAWDTLRETLGRATTCNLLVAVPSVPDAGEERG